LEPVTHELQKKHGSNMYRSKFLSRFVDTWPDTQIKITADLFVDIDGGGTDGHGDGVVITV